MSVYNEKLAWCIEHAPDAIKKLSDTEILDYMSSSYDKHCDIYVDAVKDVFVVDDLDALRAYSNVDKIVLVLARIFGSRSTFDAGYYLKAMIPELAYNVDNVPSRIQASTMFEDLKSAMVGIAEYLCRRKVVSKYFLQPVAPEDSSLSLSLCDYDNTFSVRVSAGWDSDIGGTVDCTISINQKIFGIEHLVADKLVSALGSVSNATIHDMFDVYCLANCFDINYLTVNNCITNGAEKGLNWDNYASTEEQVSRLSRLYKNMQLTSSYVNVQFVKPEAYAVVDKFNILAAGALSNENYVLKRRYG